MCGRKKQNEKNADSSWTDKAADTIAGTGIKLQNKFAKLMNNYFSKLPNKKLKIGLVLFCLLSGGFSIYLGIHAIIGKETISRVLEVKRISTPRHFDKTGAEINDESGGIPEDLYKEIQAYKKYMDSLGLPMRRGLADSIKLLEQIFQLQKK